MRDDFKAFIMRGNALDLAVGIIIGAAFGAIVNSLVKDCPFCFSTIPIKATRCPECTSEIPAA